MGYKKIGLWLVAVLCFCGVMAHAQLADLDLLEDDDRSFGVAVTRAPDPTSGYDAESRSGILLLPLRVELLHFEGGMGAYFTQSIAEGNSAASLQWRLQGGPQFGKFGLQFYVEGFWKQGIDYAGFFRIAANSISGMCLCRAALDHWCVRIRKRHSAVRVSNAMQPPLGIGK